MFRIIKNSHSSKKIINYNNQVEMTQYIDMKKKQTRHSLTKKQKEGKRNKSTS